MNLKRGAGFLLIPLGSMLAGMPAAYGQISTTGADVGIGANSSMALTPNPRGQTFTYGADVGLGETDNVNLSPTDKVSQTMATADVDFALQQQTRLLDLNVKGDFSDYNYLEGAYGNEFIGRFDGTGKLALVPDRLTWVLQDDFGQAQLDPYTPVTPNNLQNINYVSTGPDLALRLGGTGFFNASARYAEAAYETSPFSSNRLLGSLAGGVNLSPNSSLSLNVDSERVLFDNTLVNSDFDLSSAYVRYVAQGARTKLTANLGASEISQAGATTTKPLGELALTRALSQAASLTLSGGRELTDPATSFSTIQSGAISLIGVAPAILTSTSYIADYASGEWDYVRNRTTVRVSARWEKDTYGSQPIYDNTHAGGEFSVARQLTQAFSAQLLGRWYKTDYPHGLVTTLDGVVTEIDGVPPPENGIIPADTANTDYAIGTIGAALTWRHGRWLEIRARFEHSSETVTGPGSGYTENRVFVTVGYRPLPPGATAVAPGSLTTGN